MKNIKSIQINNVKGIKSNKIDFLINPYFPTFFIAPNGYGKSSMACGFNSLNRNRIKLHKNDFHENNENNLPTIKVEITNDDNSIEVLHATQDTNQISKKFNICVINNKVKPVANLRRIQGNSITSPTLEIEDIYLIEGIPIKANFNYKVSNFKTSIDDNRKIWININSFLINKKFISKVRELGILSKFTLIKETQSINNFITIVKTIKGSSQYTINEINNNHLDKIQSKYFNTLIVEIKKIQPSTQAECYLIAVQMIDFYQKHTSHFNDVIDYYDYILKKEKLLDIFKSFKSTWKNITPIEIKITKKQKKKLVTIKTNFGIKFPKSTDISNGERDVITFIGMLLKAEANLGKKPTILIIDEVFDYLDDANLVAVQYYITKFINYYKTNNIKFFPIILTHLNPYYFKNYYFSKQKICYLQKWQGNVNRHIENIIISRNNTRNKSYSNNLSKYFLHFHPNDINIETELKSEYQTQKINTHDTNLCDSNNFSLKINKSFENYIKGSNKYDPISVCIATRIKIENKIYQQLNSIQQIKFIDIHKTKNKLDFASEFLNDSIPEIYYLLGTLYNEILHVRNNQDNSSPIYLKLCNLTIMNMIKDI